jgi:hypothetical protein
MDPFWTFGGGGVEVSLSRLSKDILIFDGITCNKKAPQSEA